MARKYPPMSVEEKADWYALEEYVRHNIMGYTTQGINSFMVLRLKGLRYGQAIANNKFYKHAGYSFKTILNTFKACSIKIKNAIREKTFKDENAKFNYIMAIVDRNIADVSKREQYAKQAREEAERKEVEETQIASAPEYKPKKRKDKEKFSDLW